MPPTDRYRAPEVDANRPAATTWKAVDMAYDNNKKANIREYHIYQLMQYLYNISSKCGFLQTNEKEKQSTKKEYLWIDKIKCLSFGNPYHESNTLSSMFVALENDIDDVILVRSEVEQMHCDENEFMNDDDDEDNESEDVEPTYESEDKEASEEEEDDGVD
ncbi:hypothetical protein L6452_39228 [Arctium lappa]|uniref:Uncharacterized protein n=1 Tax=Arctium lappa TaxID=4217 RepID=A0ACB8XSW0_ARCLA|nr:hypothetical protein L6452_39228 [Arctium lappa]